MWERFESFADDFIIRAQAQCMEENLKRVDGDQSPEVFVSKLRTEFTCPTGPTSSGSTLVLLRSSYVPRVPETIPHGIDLEAVDELALINSFNNQAAGRPCRTWWLRFLPGTGPQDSWAFEHADTEDDSGFPVRASDTAWIARLMPMRREKRSKTLPSFDAFEVDSNPIWPNGYSSVDRFPDIWIKEAKKGFPTKQVLTASAFAKELNVGSNAAKVLAWYGHAAQCGQAASLILLGRMYARGEGVPKDMYRALVLFYRAAAQGVARARCMLGDFFECGMGVPQDLQRAVQCYLTDAENGYAASEYRLAYMHKYGRGLEKDQIAAWNWYARSVQHGNFEAVSDMDVLALNAKDLPSLDWSGEHRTRMAAWLKGRRSRSSEREAAETALMMAETCDAIIESNALTTDQIRTLVAAGNVKDGLVANQFVGLLMIVQAAGIDLSPILFELFQCPTAFTRMHALECLRNCQMPHATIDKLIAGGLADKSTSVRSLAEEIEANYQKKVEK